MNGYTMEDARRIIAHAMPVAAYLNPLDPDYPALLEIYRLYVLGRDPVALASMAFSLGRAIGIRDERARRNRVRVDPPDPQAVRRATQAADRAHMEREFESLLRTADANEKKATLAVLTAMAAGADNIDAFRAGNDVLQAAGRPPFPVAAAR